MCVLLFPFLPSSYPSQPHSQALQIGASRVYFVVDGSSGNQKRFFKHKIQSSWIAYFHGIVSRFRLATMFSAEVSL